MSFLTRVRSLVVFVFLAGDRRLRAGWRAFLFLPGFGLLLAPGSLMVAFMAGRERLKSNFELGLLAQGFLGLMSASLAAWVLLRFLDKRSFRTLGLWFYQGWGRELGLGLLGGFVLLSVVVATLVLGGQVEFTGWRMDAWGALRGLGWVLLLLVPAAAFEEMLFRGYPFQRLVEAAGPVIAITLLSALFGLGHRHNPNATLLSTANTVLIGIFLAVAYLKTRGLWLPIGFHFAWNFVLGFLYSLPVSGLVLSQQLLAAEIGGPQWLSGGKYGPEGSLLTTGVSLAATVWLARTRRLGVSPALAACLPDGAGPAKEVQ